MNCDVSPFGFRRGQPQVKDTPCCCDPEVKSGLKLSSGQLETVTIN